MKKVFAFLFFSSLFFLTSCSQNQPEDIKLNLQIDTLIAKSSFDAALNKCNELLEKYPNSPYAMKATLEIGKFYHSKAISNMDEKAQIENAVKYYLQVYNKYPDSTDTPKALFYVGFLLANELEMYDSAKVVYNKFLKVYPDNELSQHVKYEIENIGLTPDQILNKNQKK